MATSMWKGAIQFGLVSVPCKAYLGLDPHTSGAHLLHAECSNQIQQKIVCPVCERTIPRSETVRGFQVAVDRWVTVSEAELAGLPVRTLHTIEVGQFVPVDEALRLETWSRQPYYLAPEPLGRRAFALLCRTLEETRLAGIAQITIREREHLATVRPLEDGLLLTTLAWPSEVRPIADLDLPPHADVSAAELALAQDLVRAMGRPFDPAAYRDEYSDALRRLVESKAEGAAFTRPDSAPSACLVDLMAALEASVAAARGRASAPEDRSAGQKPAGRRKRAVATAA